jgi:hypothetical protein
MAQDNRTTSGIDERMLFIHQSLRYAEDFVRLYEETEAMRKELHRVKVRLAAEIMARRKAEKELRGRTPYVF